MKYLPFVTALLFGFAASSIIRDIGLSDMYWKWKIEKVANNSIENMENLKRDCEKSLPRDKECVLVFDYVSAENDYENN